MPPADPIPDKQWTAEVTVVYRTTVLVEAASTEEAASKLESGDWIDDGMEGAERVNWTIRTKPKEDK